MATKEFVLRALLSALVCSLMVFGAPNSEASLSEDASLVVSVVEKQAASKKNDSSSSIPIFAEVADQVGLDFQHYNGTTGQFYLPEIMGSGAALLDYDNDGDLDVFMVQGSVIDPKSNPRETLFPWSGSASPRSRLYRNDLVIGKDGSRKLKFTDVTEKSGIVASGYGMGVA